MGSLCFFRAARVEDVDFIHSRAANHRNADILTTPRKAEREIEALGTGIFALGKRAVKRRRVAFAGTSELGSRGLVATA